MTYREMEARKEPRPTERTSSDLFECTGTGHGRRRCEPYVSPDGVAVSSRFVASATIANPIAAGRLY